MLENSLVNSPARLATTSLPKPTFGDVLGATAAESLEFNVTNSIIDAAQPSPTDDIISAEEANKKYAIGDLRFLNPISNTEARRVAQKKQAEIQRARIYESGPQGFGVSAAQFGVGFATSLIDPAGIILGLGAGRLVSGLATGGYLAGRAAAATPGLNVLRNSTSVAAAMAGRSVTAATEALAATTFSRGIARGAAEGALGATLVEPFILSYANRNQLNYDAADSLLNVIFGAGIGGGFGAGVTYFERRAAASNLKDLKQREEALKRLDREHRQNMQDYALEYARLDNKQKAIVFKNAFAEVMQDQFPLSFETSMQRYKIERAAARGLSELTYKIDNTLSVENVTRLQRRSKGMPVASIPIERFDTRAKADAFIRKAENRSDYIIQKNRDSDGFVVSKVKQALPVKDFTGAIRRFASDANAKKYLADNKIDGGVVRLQETEGRAQQSIVLIKGITQDEADLISRNPNFTEFYEPTPVGSGLTPEEIVSRLAEKPKPYRFNPDDMENSLAFSKEDKIPEVEFDVYAKATQDNDELASTALSDLEAIGDLSEDDINIINAIRAEMAEDMAESKIVGPAARSLAICIKNRGGR